MPRLGESRLALQESLEQRYGPLPWPGAGPVSFDPADPFASIVRVALGLLAEPRVASAAFDALRDAGLVEPEGLAKVNLLEVDDIFQQARVRLASKALKPLQRIAKWANELGLVAEGFASLSTESIREEWRSLNGVGTATADTLLLFALGRPTFPVDRASYRILARHGWLDSSSDYDEARSTLESIAPDDPGRLAQLALALDKLGRDCCKPSAPRCEQCPLRPLLPEGGPIASNG